MAIQKREAREVFYIVNWPYHEHHKMNSVKRVGWVKAKVEWGEDWLKLMSLDERAEAVMAWEIVRGLAAQSPYRGLLLREGHKIEPHTVRTMAMQTAAPEEQLAVGLASLERQVGWVRRVRWRGTPRTMSRRIYAQVYSKFEVSGRDSDAKLTPNGRDLDAKQTPSHSHIHSRSQGSETTPPLPPSAEGRRLEAEDGSELDGSWGNGSWEVIGKLAEKDLVNKLWLPHLKMRTADLTAWPCKDVIGHLIDLHRARDKAKSMDEVFKRLFWRLQNAKAPSAKNRRIVEKFLRHAR